MRSRNNAWDKYKDIFHIFLIFLQKKAETDSRPVKLCGKPRQLPERSRTSTADLMQVYDDDLLVGFIHLVYFEDVVYLYYFAIEPDERGQGYGSKILQALRRRFSARRIILNIEAVDENCDNYEERKKRKEFYLKNGFREAGYSTREYGVEYEMLYLGGNVSYEEFLALIRKYFGRTLALMVKKNFKKA